MLESSLFQVHIPATNFVVLYNLSNFLWLGSSGITFHTGEGGWGYSKKKKFIFDTYEGFFRRLLILLFIYYLQGVKNLKSTVYYIMIFVTFTDAIFWNINI